MSSIDRTKLYVIEGAYLASLQRTAKRLFTENRMDGNEMRDAAQAITAAVDNAFEMPEVSVK